MTCHIQELQENAFFDRANSGLPMTDSALGAQTNSTVIYIVIYIYDVDKIIGSMILK